MQRILFLLNPETAHHAALKSLKISNQFGLSKLYPRIPSNPKTIMGLTFPNPIGLAAGFDKNGDYIDALAALGFGFIEIGTITPKPQLGNPRPRLFRLTKQKAIINRMGFNNKGIDHVVNQLERIKYKGILGINIGKNKDTLLENAVDDYLLGFRAFWKYASYITINISSPNTPGLRDLQQAGFLSRLLCVLKQEQHSVMLNHNKYVPLVVKISPDLSSDDLHTIAKTLLAEKIDAVIATNTTINREDIKGSIHANEAGGLSGAPLQKNSTEVIKQLHSILQDNIPIIASGGVMDEVSAYEKINAGASLLQIYSGFIFSGLKLINRLAKIF